MDYASLKKRLKQLTQFCSCKNKTQFICICSDDEVECLCELVYNILYLKGFNIKKKVLYMLKKLRLILHFLADSKVPVLLKRKLLSRVGKKLFPIIRKHILPRLKKQYKEYYEEEN